MSQEYRINIMQENPSAESVEPEEIKTAGVMERFVALLIDAGIVLFAYQVFLILVLKFFYPSLEQLYALCAGVLVPFILYEAYFSCYGRHTLGKKLVGIAVVNAHTAEPIGFFRSLLRAVGYVFSSVLLMCGFLLAFIDDKHRALHDYLAGTIVLEARHKSWGEKTALTLTGTVLLAAFCFYFYAQLFGTGSFAQKRLILQAEEHLEKIGYLEEVHRMNFGYYTNDLLRLSILSGDPVQFQRDTQAVLDRKGFKIGVGQKGYKISARAKDVRKTAVYYPSL